jgi:hydrogenase maturation protein HypF
MGRLFDGVAAILGLRKNVSFEGQAAMELEGASYEASTIGAVYPFTIAPAPGESKSGGRIPDGQDPAGGIRVAPVQTDGEGSLILDMTPAIRAMVEEKLAGKRSEDMAFSFHRTLIISMAAMAERIRQKTGLTRIALSGGCFQNRVLLNGCINILSEAGFDVYCHRLVPTNDGCICLGQAVSAGARLKLAS